MSEFDSQASTSHCPVVVGDNMTELVSSQGDLRVTICAILGDLWVAYSDAGTLRDSSAIDDTFSSYNAFLVRQGATQVFESHGMDEGIYVGSGGDTATVFSYTAVILPV